MFEECGARMNDHAVTDRLFDFLGKGEDDLAERYQTGEPFVPMAPYLATPNVAVVALRSALIGSGLDCIFETYRRDTFTNGNPEKVATARPVVTLQMQGTKGLVKVSERLRLVEDIEGSNGQRIGELSTFLGVSLGDFYDQLTDGIMPDVRIYDISDELDHLAALNEAGGSTAARKYYLGTMALCQVYGMGVNVGGNEDPKFYQEVVKPAILDAATILEVTPISLSVPGLPTGKKARIIPTDFSCVEEVGQLLDQAANCFCQ
jgi:hypothetical protein